MNFIFVHGLIGEPSNWDLVVEPIARQGYRCTVPEVNFFDESTYRIEDFSEQMWSSLPRDVTDQPSVIVGNSIGCSLALYLADRCTAACLVAPFTKMYSYPIPRNRDNIASLLQSLVHDPTRLRDNEVARHVERYRGVLDPKGRRKHLQKLRKVKVAAETFDHDGLYRRHQAKIHMIFAANDVVSPPSLFHEMKREFPGMTLHEVPDCGHAVPLERPDLLAEILLEVARRPANDDRRPQAIPAE